MTHSVVDRDTSRECHASFNLLLRTLVHVTGLPSQQNQHVNDHITRRRNNQTHSSSTTYIHDEINTYSLMNESPISQTSTILAFGLHSAITLCKASANFHIKNKNQTQSAIIIKHETLWHHNKTLAFVLYHKLSYIHGNYIARGKRARKLLLTISAALLYLVTTSGEVRSNSFSSLLSSDDIVSTLRKPEIGNEKR